MARFEEARDRASEAIAIAQEAAATEEEGAARVVLGVALAFLGDPGSGERELREGLRLATEAGNAEDIGRAYKDLAEVMRIQGRFDAALDVAREGEEVVARFGAQDSDGSFMAVNAAEDLLRLGRWEEARAQLDELSRRRLGPTGRLLYESVASRLEAARGRFEEADAGFERVLGLIQSGGPAEYLPAIYAGWAEADLWRGDPESALRRVRQGLEAVGDALDPLNAPILYNVGARAEADAGQDSSEVAEELLAGLQDLLLQHSIGGFVPPEAAAHLASCRGEVARAKGEPSADLWAEAGARLAAGRPALSRRLRRVAGGGGAPARRPPARGGERAAARRGRRRGAARGRAAAPAGAAAGGMGAARPRRARGRRAVGAPGTGRPHHPRGPGPAPDRGRAHRSRDRRAPRDLLQDRQPPRVPHPPEAQRPRADRGGKQGAAARAPGLLTGHREVPIGK